MSSKTWLCKGCPVNGDRAWSCAATSQGMFGRIKALDEARRILPLRVSQGAWPWWLCEFRLLASKTVKLSISIALSHLVYGTSLRRPRKLILASKFQFRDKNWVFSGFWQASSIALCLPHIHYKVLSFSFFGHKGNKILYYFHTSLHFTQNEITTLLTWIST